MIIIIEEFKNNFFDKFYINTSFNIKIIQICKNKWNFKNIQKGPFLISFQYLLFFPIYFFKSNLLDMWVEDIR